MADGGSRRDGARGRAERVRPGALVVLLVVLALAAGACGGGPGAGAAGAGPTRTTAPRSPESTVVPVEGDSIDAPGGSAHLRVTQHQTACCYPHGQVYWLLIRDAGGHEVVQRRFRPLADVAPAVDTTLPAGRYHLVAAQQPCTTSTCAHVADPVDRCDADLELVGGQEVFLTVGVSPGAGCAVGLAPGPPASTLTDAVALPGDAVDCGFDPTLAEVAATGRAVRVSSARRCLMAAVQLGDAAWLLAAEPELVVYRSRSDGAVDLYRVLDEQAPVWAWVRTTCTTMVPDEVRGFLLRDCSAPEAVPWA